ncbi:hypothetical protein F4679DRAFT_421568 [Xylaria curta]|nr:hypothetical protein F4679DRAFT_421568 [Xylaria curta]
MLEAMGSQVASPVVSAPITNGRKKRIACDNCHLSKVRCTGELTGCQRCERGRKLCHYSESNMGRTLPRGVSKRRKSTLHKALDLSAAAGGQRQQQKPHDWDSVSLFDSIDGNEPSSHQQVSAPTLLGGMESSEAPIDDPMTLWDRLGGHPQQQLRQQEAQNNQHVKSALELTSGDLDNLGFDPFASTFDDIDISDMGDGDLELGESSLNLTFPQTTVTPTSVFITTSSPTHLQSQRHKSQAPPQSMQGLRIASSSSASRRSHDSDSELKTTSDAPNSLADGIRYWSTQLEALFHAVQRSPIPLDGTLHRSSQLLPRIRETLQSLQSADALTFPAVLVLILVCLAQMITLYEQCVPSVLAGSLSAGSGSCDLSLLLGDFQVDRKAQQALQIHIVNKELLEILQVLRIIRQTLLRPEWHSTSKRTHDLLLDDVRVRTVTLVYQMKHKRAHLAQ